MDICSVCPVRVGSVVWQPRPGAHALTVACKATYVLEPGTSPFIGEQEELHASDVAWDGPQGSLRRAGDLVPFKRRPEVLLVGHAYAAGGRPVPSLVARMVVGDVDKAIEVSGDRWISAGDDVSDPTPFARMPLCWERAAGGPGTRNPVGMALESPGPRGRVAVPNLTPPGLRVTSWRAPIPPAAFGPLRPAWPDRLEKLHHHAHAWDRERWFAAPMPEGVDGAYFNAAPADQQTTEIRADERIVLEHLHPRHARLVTNLQALEPRVTAAPAGGPQQVLRLRRDTLLIDTDRGIATLVWRATMVLSHPQQPGRVVVTLDAGGAPAWITQADRVAGEVSATLPLDSALGGLAAASMPPVVRSPAHLGGTAMVDASKGSAGPALPFVGGPSAVVVAHAPSPPVVRAPAALSGTLSTDAMLVQRGAALPFGPGVALPPPSVSPQVMPSAADPPDPAAAPAPPAAPGLPAPPPMLGPIVPVAEEAGEASEALERATDLAAGEATSATSEVPVAEQTPARALSLEEHAAIAASLARRKADRSAILAEREITEATWQASERRWKDAIREESSRGRAHILQRYDEAYVAQLEAERGPISAAEWARLVVAAERGTHTQALVDLGLPRGAMLTLQRVWMRKAAAHAHLRKQIAEETEAARQR